MAAMPVNGPRLGAHVAIRDGLVKGAERAAQIGLESIQIFGDNPTAWRRRGAPSDELPAFRERLAGAAIAPVAIHASYLVNPAGADRVNRERSIELLAAELVAAPDFGATLVNVHIGSHGGAGVEAGIDSLVDVVARSRELAAAGASDLPTITLENGAGGGFGLGLDVGELAAIANRLDAAGLD